MRNSGKEKKRSLKSAVTEYKIKCFYQLQQKQSNNNRPNISQY